jgi:hypothetical protein
MPMKTVITSSYAVLYLAAYMRTTTTTTHNLVPLSAFILRHASSIVERREGTNVQHQRALVSSGGTQQHVLM